LDVVDAASLFVVGAESLFVPESLDDESPDEEPPSPPSFFAAALPFLP
jgi:hypothetical protein